MKRCEFLSLGGEYNECFTDCPFYEWEENDGICPFEEEDLKIFQFDEMYKTVKEDGFY